jgi:class 3 adenylate cyclase/2-oxo-4-hydroxy-4-carboxy--5-ureidoimidazoline (OHCU) decarboxylase
MAPIQTNGMLLDFLNASLLSDTPDVLERLVENGLIVQDENFSHEDIERVVFLKLGLGESDWLKCAAAEAPLSTDEEKSLSGLFQYLKNKERLIQNGYRQTMFHCKRGNIETCYPLYFPLPQELSLGDNKRSISLTDIENKVVFVGLSGTGLNALNPTPYTVRYTMASLNATTFNTITTGGFLQKRQWLEPYLILIYGFVVFLAVFFWPAWLSLVISVAMACAHVFLIAQLLETSGWIIAIVTPVISILGAYLIANLLLYMEQQRERKKIRAMFSSMVSQEVLKIMEDEPERFNLQGDKVEASMFSSDVSGFTSISEGVTAQELALILNLYLTPMSNLVMTYGGYVEKYEGDAIKADFGVPLPDDDHAWKACFSALLQQEELTVVQRMLQIKYGVVISARMGVNTGVVNAGMMGSDQKMQYCALGEEVAMAEELEPANKMWESWIAISPETLRLTGDRLETRLLDTVAFPHVTIPVYELLAWKKSAFLAFWQGKAIPKLVIEGWERIIPEKLLAYLDYYRENSFEQHAFYELMLEAFSAQEQNAMTYVEVNDRIELADMEQRFHDLSERIRSLGANIGLDDLDPVDRTEMDELLAAEQQAIEPWRKKIESHLVELKWSNHRVNALAQSLDQSQQDEFNTAIDTLEKNCHCILKRTRFPTDNDQYGNSFKAHLTSMLNDDPPKLSAEELNDLKKQRAKLLAELKQAMVLFIKQAKPLAASYHEMMADHCLMDESQRSVCESYAKGHELYLAQQWDEAGLHFQQGLKTLPGDGPCLTLLKRCENFKKNPPQKDWDGTWVADW